LKNKNQQKNMISNTGAKDSSKLAVAAEELIKAASTLQAESTSLTHATETVQSLKSMDSKLNALSTLNESISDLKEEVNKSILNLKNELNIQPKDQKLQWAITNAEHNCFQYSNYVYSPGVPSTSVVKQILFTFRRGFGAPIDGYRIDHFDLGEKRFRDALSNQIHELLGHKPRIELEDGKHVIYYK
jgi:hypothetical protein